jgi:iron complex transport system substrate-binding protein
MEKKNKIIILIFVILLICGGMVYLFLTPSSIETSGSKNITDMANRTVQIPATINKVVATSPPMTTMIYMLAPDKLTAVNFQWTDEESEFIPSQYKNLPVVGGWFGSQDGNYEEFIASEPDIIIESLDEGMGVNLATVEERQDKFGKLPVIAVEDTTDVTKVDGSIKFLGLVLGEEDKAQALIDFRDKYLDEVEKVSGSIPDSNKKTVYYAEGSDGLETDPSGSSHSQLINLCGGINVADVLFENGTGTVQVSIEQVIKWNPDIIITTDTQFYHSVYNDPKWANIKAVQNKEVYLSPQSPFKWFDRPPGANIIIGIPWTAKVIYPDKYADLDLKQATKEFYNNFYHFDLSDDQVKDILTGSGIKEQNL